MKLHKKKKMMIAIGVLLLLLIPYVRADVLTLLHGKECLAAIMEPNQRIFDLKEEPSFYRVLSYENDSFEVYYVYNDALQANKSTYKKTEAGWVLDGFDEVIWQKRGGSSDMKFMYPYYFRIGAGNK